MTFVVLDANAVGVDPPLGKVQHGVLLDAHRAGRIRLVIPQLSLREAVNSWQRDQLQPQLSKLDAAHRQIRKLDPGLRLPDLRVDVRARAEEMLGQHTEALERAGVQMPPPPEVDHGDLVERALHRRQPFNVAGSGYRDALLWHLVLEYGRQDDTILVSSDHTAFAEGRKEDGALAGRLASESGGSRVTLLGNLHRVIELLELVQQDALSEARSIVDRLGPGEFAGRLRHLLVEDLGGPVHRWVIRDLVNPFLTIQSTASLGLAYNALGATVEEARRADGGRIEAGVMLDVQQYVTVFAPLAAAEHLDAVGEIRGFHEVDDVGGWEIDAIVRHRCRVVLNPLRGEIEQAGVEETVSARR